MKKIDFYLSKATWLVRDHKSERRWSALRAQFLNHRNTLYRVLYRIMCDSTSAYDYTTRLPYNTYKTSEKSSSQEKEL